MKIFGSWSELRSLIFSKDGQAITTRPNQSVTYTADRDVQLPPQDAASVLVSADSTQTLTNKTISGSSNTITNIPAGTAITGVLPTANGGTGQNSTATFPTSGVVVTEAGTQTLTNKTLTSPAITTPTGIVKGDVGLGNVDNTSDATKNAATVTLTNKTIDGDDNTVQDLPETAIKTNLTNASKFFTRNASGIPESATKAVPTGAVVGTTDTQALTAKDIDGGTASNTSRITLPKETTTNLNALTRKAGTVVYDTTTSEVKYDNGTVLTALSTQVQATATTLGVVQGGTVPGTTAGAVGAGYIGEKIETVVTTDQAGSTTSGTWTTGATLASLSVGIWDITVNFPYIDLSGSTGDAGAVQGRIVNIRLYDVTAGAPVRQFTCPGLSKAAVSGGYMISSGCLVVPGVNVTTPTVFRSEFNSSDNSGVITISALSAAGSSARPIVISAVRVG